MAELNTEISPQLRAQLEQVARDMPRDCRDEVAEKIGYASDLFSYDLCIWWNGCYYCRDQQGVWAQIKCFT